MEYRTMDATRQRRTRDSARQRWYGQCRTRRLARRFFGVAAAATDLSTQRQQVLSATCLRCVTRR
jgi:hypothetical protein